MAIIKIISNENGSHTNKSDNMEFPLPDGYAVIPPDVGTPDTLENFPFGEITVEDRDGVPTVTSWTPLPMPDPDPEPAPAPEERYTADDMLSALLGGTLARESGGGVISS